MFGAELQVTARIVLSYVLPRGRAATFDFFLGACSLVGKIGFSLKVAARDGCCAVHHCLSVCACVCLCVCARARSLARVLSSGWVDCAARSGAATSELAALLFSYLSIHPLILFLIAFKVGNHLSVSREHSGTGGGAF